MDECASLLILTVLPIPYATIPVTEILKSDVFYALPNPNPLEDYGHDGVPSVVPNNSDFQLRLYLVKLFRLHFSTFTFPSCWEYAYIQPVPLTSVLLPIPLLSCISKAFESIPKQEILKHQSTLTYLIANIGSARDVQLVIFLSS